MWAVLIASAFWSVVPAVSIDLILNQSMFIILAVLCISRHRHVGFYGPLLNAVLLFLFLTVLFCLLFPGAAYSSQGLRGFLIHKNSLGAMLAICIFVLWFAPQRKRWHAAIAILTFILLVLTRSKTAISLVVICSLLLVLAAWWCRHMYPSRAELMVADVVRRGMLCIVVLALLWLVLFRDNALAFVWEYLPKDALTGRGTLWRVVIQQVWPHSLLGLGPGAFWQAEGASEIVRTTLYRFDPKWVQSMVSADGSYVDLFAAFGMLGLSVFLLTAVELYARLLRQWAEPDSRLMFVLVTFVLLHAVTETTLLSSPNILWLIYLLCYLRVAGRVVPLRAACASQ